MAGNILNRHFWLINTIREWGPISLNEISERWKSSNYNPYPGSELPRKTFHNHCRKIEELFGVTIECDKKSGNYLYYIPEVAYSEKWKMKLMNDLLLFNEVKDDPALSKRVFDMDKNEDPRVPELISCIKKNRLVSFVMPNSDKAMESVDDYMKLPCRKRFEIALKMGTVIRDFLPLSLVHVKYNWFVIGTCIHNDEPMKQENYSVYHMGSMHHLSVGAHSDIKIKEFSLSNYINEMCYNDKKADGTTDHFLFFKDCVRNSNHNALYKIRAYLKRRNQLNIKKHY